MLGIVKDTVVMKELFSYLCSFSGLVSAALLVWIMHWAGGYAAPVAVDMFGVEGVFAGGVSAAAGATEARDDILSSDNDSGCVCAKCQLVSSLVEKVDQLGPSQRGEWVTSRRHSRKAKANANAEAKASPPEHHTPPIYVSNRFAPLSKTPAEEPVKSALVIGDSIVRHVKLATPFGAPAVTVSCLPGARAPDISGNLRLLANKRYSRIVIHVGANDIRLRQSEVTKGNIREVIKLAQTMSDAVICSGPIPMRRGAEAYSRLSALNCWMSKWCPENEVGFIDNWLHFKGKPGLIGRDVVHPMREGAALLSCSIAHSLLVSRQSSVNSC
ncbi:uncharacterized protein LOC118803642 [Colossoma macropomum]|uniref:uncharacterized protein LOC118803642 n=1 Tax=Colossoma macropomum TaxID=42526 RepID=UPI001864F753|nr:uncharacterized protein LOC118803642 [Colossoma macropomum]